MIFHPCVSAQSSATLVETLRDLIDKSELGPLFRELPLEHFPTLQYLTDFVHMVYKSSSESEHQVSSAFLHLLEKKSLLSVTVPSVKYVKNRRVQARI